MIAAIAFCAALLGAFAARAQPAPKAPAVAVSTRTVTVGELYKAERLRDPFVMISGGGGGRPVAADKEKPAEFSIHNLVLKGILQDRAGYFAILVDPNSGASYILKNKRLYDSKKKPVPGVTGDLKPGQKMVHLMTPDKDVQTLILGEEEGT